MTSKTDPQAPHLPDEVARGRALLGVFPILDPDLQAQISSWSELPDHVRLMIRTLLDTAVALNVRRARG